MDSQVDRAEVKNLRSEELKKIIQQGEGLNVEFKTSFGKEVVETICAFANHEGGHVLVGVNDAGDVVGIQGAPEQLQKWINQVKQQTEPSIIPDIEWVHVGCF